MRNQDINLDGRAIYREAVRGVIIKDRTLLRLYTSMGRYR